MMTVTSNTGDVLNDLIQINNDRIQGYKKAIKQLKPKDTDLIDIFNGFIAQSEKLKAELNHEVLVLGQEIEGGTTTPGNIYRAWMTVKAAFTGDDRQTTLNNCEFGEDAAQSAYRTAESTEDLIPTVKAKIIAQRMELKTSHDQVKLLRDRENL